MIEVGKMDNKEVRQISDEDIKKELTREELQQTQVLNFQEVQETVKFEKHNTVVGIIQIVFGSLIIVAAIVLFILLTFFNSLSMLFQNIFTYETNL